MDKSESRRDQLWSEFGDPWPYDEGMGLFDACDRIVEHEQRIAVLEAQHADMLEAAKAGYIALMHANEPDGLDRKAMEMLGDAIRKARTENSDG